MAGGAIARSTVTQFLKPPGGDVTRLENSGSPNSRTCQSGWQELHDARDPLIAELTEEREGSTLAEVRV